MTIAIDLGTPRGQAGIVEQAALSGAVGAQTALHEFTDRLYRSESVADVYDAALEAIRHALGCERASILIFDASSTMKFVAWRGLSDGYRQAVEGHSPWARNATDPKPICIADIDTADTDDALKATVKAEGIGALAFIPLVEKGELVGKFMTYYGAPHVFTDAEMDIGVTIARQLGFAVAKMRAETARLLAEQQLSDFFDNASVGMHWVGPDGTILRANRCELEMLGYRHDEYVGRHIADFHVNQPVITDILKRLSNREVLDNYEVQLRHKDGSIRDVLITSSVHWNQDRFVHTRCFTTDITGRKRGERAGRLLASIIETSDDAIVSKDLNSIVTSWNKGAERLFGYKAHEIIGKTITLLIPAGRLNEEHEIIERIRSGEPIKHYETVRIRKDGSLVDISLSVSPVTDDSGKVIGASKIARDITDRKQAQARTEFLTKEVQHRTKNLFAVVQSVVGRSFAGKRSVSEAQSAVMDRLHSLGQTHLMLMDKDWQGADLADVVRSEMSPYAGRVTVDGPPVVLNAKAAQNFALMLHELATNAAKYGSLSNTSGQVHIGWSVTQPNGSRRYVFHWQEQGGPRVYQPQGKGFGSAVLEQVMAEYSDSQPVMDFAETGLIYQVSGSLATIAGEGAIDAEAEAARPIASATGEE
jgi:PAS domain S-box-containing protein